MASLARVAPASVAPLRYSPTLLPLTPDITELQIPPEVTLAAGGGGGLDIWAGLCPEDVDVWIEDGLEDIEAVLEDDTEPGLGATGTVYPQSSEAPPPPGATGGAGKLEELTMSLGSSYLEINNCSDKVNVKSSDQVNKFKYIMIKGKVLGSAYS